MSDNLNFENKEDMEKTIVMEPISETKNIQEDTSKKFEIEVVDDFDFLHKDNNETEKQNDEVKQPELNQILEYKNDNNESIEIEFDDNVDTKIEENAEQQQTEEVQRIEENDIQEENVEQIQESEALNIKAIKKINKYYQKMCQEIAEKDDPNDKEKLDALKAEIEKNDEILRKINIASEASDDDNNVEIKPKEEKKVENIVKIEENNSKSNSVKEEIEENLVVILDCLRGEYLIRKSDLIEFKAYEIRTRLLDNRTARKEYIDYLQQKFGNFETDEIDITLCNAIEEHYRDDERADSLISQYIKAINNTDKSELPFKLVYNFNGLKDLKKEGFLTRTASSKLLTVADFVKEYELGEVQKEETGLKRVINSVKRFFTKREFRGNIDLLTEGEELRKVKILFQNGTYSLECGESKGKKYGDIYMYEAKCKIDDYDEIDKVEEEYDIRLSNKDISRFDITIYKLLKNLESLNIRAEDRDLNNLAEGYLKSIISKELSYEVENLLDITYDLGCFEYISEDILSDYDLKQLKKKSKYAEKIGIAKVEYNDNEEELSEELISNLNNSGYFCKIADETDLDEQNKMALERLNEKIKNKSGVEGDEESIVKEIAKENGISLKVNNIVKSLQQLKVEILDKKLKENN